MSKGVVIGIVVVLILFMIGGGVLFWVFVVSDSPEVAEEIEDEIEEVEEDLPPDPEPMAPPSVIEADRYYEDRLHLVEGSIDVPTVCHYVNLDHQVQVGEVDTAPVVILSFESRVEVGDRVCEPVTSARFFSSEIEADEDVVFEAYFDGRPVDLVFREDNLSFEDADEEEIPEDLFIKD